MTDFKPRFPRNYSSRVLRLQRRRQITDSPRDRLLSVLVQSVIQRVIFNSANATRFAVFGVFNSALETKLGVITIRVLAEGDTLIAERLFSLLAFRF